MWPLGTYRMKIQEASKDFTEEEIMFPSSKTSYIEQNTLKYEENKHFNTGIHSEAPKRTKAGARCP